MGERVSTLGVDEECLYYDIILKTAKRHRAARRFELERFMTNDKPGSERIRLANLAPQIMPAEPGMSTSILAMPVVWYVRTGAAIFLQQWGLTLK